MASLAVSAQGRHASGRYGPHGDAFDDSPWPPRDPRHQEDTRMKIICSALLVLAAAAVLQSLPDLARYFRMREM